MLDSNFRLLILITLVGLLCLSCGHTLRSIGMEQKVKWERISGHRTRIKLVQKDISPDKPVILLRVLRVAQHPVVKVEKYEKLRRTNHAGTGWWYGVMFGFIGGLIATTDTDSTGNFEWDTTDWELTLQITAGSSLLGVLIGSAVKGTPKRVGITKRETSKIIGYTDGEENPVGNAEVKIQILENRKVLRKRTDSSGYLRINLLHDLQLYESRNKTETYTLLASSRDARLEHKLRPSDWLVPYIRITKRIDNIRRRPSVHSSILARCRAGEVYRILSRQGNWYKIRFGTSKAWTHKSNGKEFWGSLPWMDPGKRPLLEIKKVVFWEPSGNQLLDAGETGKLNVVVANKGEGPAWDLQGILKSLRGIRDLKWRKKNLLPDLQPGSEATLSFPLQAGAKVPDAGCQFRVEFSEARGFEPDPVIVTIRTRAFRPPRIVVEDDVGIEDASRNGRIEPAEIVWVTARVRNKGAGKAEDVHARLKFGANVFPTAESRQSFSLGKLSPGASKEIRFSFYTNKRIRNRIPIELLLTESTGKYGAEMDLGLAVTVPRKPTRIIVFGEKKEKPRDRKEPLELTIDVEKNIPVGRYHYPDAVAVIIGNRDYEHQDVPTVDFALRDAQWMAVYVERLFGYHKKNIHVIENARKSDFELWFGTAENTRGKLSDLLEEDKSDIFVYYSGHGAPHVESKKHYFLPVDGDPNPDYLQLTGYRKDLLEQNLSLLPARSVYMVIDACFSGFSHEGSLLAYAKPVRMVVKNPLIAKSGTVVITSSAADQISSWVIDKKHSLFTYFFLKALQGEANITRDKSLTIKELENYLKKQVLRASRQFGRHQTPQVTARDKSKILVRYR